MQAEHLHYIVTHVFLPPKLPQKDDQKISMDWMLCDTTYQHAIKFQRHLHADEATRWAPIVRMLRCLRDSQQYNALDAHDIQRSMTDMQPGGVYSGFLAVSTESHNHNLRCICLTRPRTKCRCHDAEVMRRHDI